jgi:hypothetical protein
MRRSITMTVLGLGLGLALGTATSDPATAGVRARVELQKDLGPAQLRVRLHTPDHVVRHRAPAPLRVHRAAPWRRIGHRDRAIAYRLSVITGIPERPLVVKRARGLSWKRIARIHGITHRELFVARHPRRFARWLDHAAWVPTPCHDVDRGRGRGHRRH